MKIELNRISEWVFSLALIFFDAAIINTIFMIAFAVWLAGISEQEIYLTSYYKIRLLLFGLFLLCGTIFDLFRIGELGKSSEILFHSAEALLLLFVVFNLLLSSSRSLAAFAFTFPRPIILVSLMVSVPLIWLSRIFLRNLFTSFQKKLF